VEFINPENLSIPKHFDYYLSPWRQMCKYRFRYNPFRNVVIRHYLKHVDQIVAVSHALRDALMHNGIQNVIVIRNGIDVSVWQSSSEEVSVFRMQHGLVGKKAVLFCGRLSSAKGGKQAVQMLEKLLLSVPNAVLLVAGERDAYAQELLRTARPVGIDAHVVFLGLFLEPVG
jgi:glycosyltransferase involved in cell wall biosynthesis